jgi:uncharacterized membrane protein YoaK (UPF0700 family)
MNGVVVVIYLVLILVFIVAGWMIFTKAGEAGWKVLIPIWNTLVLLKIVGRPWWWILLLLIPIVSFVVWIVVAINLARSFDRSTGFGIGLVFLPFIFGLILAFGSSTYRGPAAAPAVATA